MAVAFKLRSGEADQLTCSAFATLSASASVSTSRSPASPCTTRATPRTSRAFGPAAARLRRPGSAAPSREPTVPDRTEDACPLLQREGRDGVSCASATHQRRCAGSLRRRIAVPWSRENIHGSAPSTGVTDAEPARRATRRRRGAQRTRSRRDPCAGTVAVSRSPCGRVAAAYGSPTPSRSRE